MRIQIYWSLFLFQVSDMQCGIPKCAENRKHHGWLLLYGKTAHMFMPCGIELLTLQKHIWNNRNVYSLIYVLYYNQSLLILWQGSEIKL